MPRLIDSFGSSSVGREVFVCQRCELEVWYEKRFADVEGLREAETGCCYRVGDGWYVSEVDFDSAFASALERELWMILRNAELMGCFDEELATTLLLGSAPGWADSELERLLADDSAGCYFTEA